ncbi:hypothetical protein SELMODRAFT_444528 [Selaginella moellendorffii]|uniref:Uncharacterized protein n=1 Tax=Selaginella moellendorffii TaxID=88036 RepID=D8SAF2_SELML|nr:protein ABCI12, chloroplastic [Selaginella moellendorffii]EFJ18742.1 hypothetical protein SELMODRAFT_444528 [Selaginella moellendorffii]|eukprot:XP_002980482.1 protein ABCI12, chloroplastic [Selaginella moellendorffii]
MSLLAPGANALHCFSSSSIFARDFVTIPVWISCKRHCRFTIAAAAQSRGRGFADWAKSLGNQEPIGARIVRMVATATSSPLAQYISSPVTVLHSLDPRVKQAWLLGLIVLSSRAHAVFRLGVVALLSTAAVSCLPKRVWQDQLGRTTLLCGLLFVMAALTTDGVTPIMQVRTPPPSVDSLPPLPPALNRYSYVFFKLGPFQLTTKGVALATTAACLSFTVLQSASLCIATTTPEDLAAGLRWFLRPLQRVGVAVDEMILTLLLSLRFTGLVFDEVRNIALAVASRGVQWKSLKLRETLEHLGTLVSRLFKNLFIHAEHITEAMIARGFKGNPEEHKLYFLSRLSIKLNDVLALAALGSVLLAAAASEILLS